MIEISNDEASGSILRYVEERRLTQGKWHGRYPTSRDAGRTD